MKRFILVVLDGFGIGAMNDTPRVRPQDTGANTCLHLLEKMPELSLPYLERLGLMNALGQEAGRLRYSPRATFGRSDLAHYWADTFAGHQEIMGSTPRKPVEMPFSQYIRAVGDLLRSSGYKVEFRGKELKLLLVNGAITVADNIEADLGLIYNVTGALDQAPFAEVLAVGRLVRSVVPVSRVIALGGEGISTADLLGALEEKDGKFIGVNCPRSGVYRQGYRVIHMGYGTDPERQVPTLLGRCGIQVTLLGKVADIVENPYGTSRSCVDTAAVLDLTLTRLRAVREGFIATNVQETDLAGHAENAEAYAGKLVIADEYLGKIMAELADDDVLLVMADHGNDPTIGHSHHTREKVPLLACGPKVPPGYFGHRATLSDVGATVAEYFGCPAPENGKSFLNLLTGNAGNNP